MYFVSYNITGKFFKNYSYSLKHHVGVSFWICKKTTICRWTGTFFFPFA